MALHIRRKVTLGPVIGSRAFFRAAPCRTTRDKVLAQLASQVKVITLPCEGEPSGATANGAVQSIPDAGLYARQKPVPSSRSKPRSGGARAVPWLT